ncbi:ECF subfamily RNA polymerase sigma factor [Alcanivorax sp. S71-1-4]|uniref:RNA polymerase sigma factor n=1 Tax=Alcanivorax sp. S71-1-4 TaxID=1177159 RepID=UPI0016A4FB0F|nr:RNA polymerase sigma factor [Alcanivorax sp. S71-1-4]KAF0804975.1 ECF subfamily RNA polymerase sigma factor [Alcanivorax sp. S71-1-4]
MSDANSASLRDVMTERYSEIRQRLVRRFGCVDLASDALHDTWLKLERYQQEGDAIRQPLGYLIRMATNAAIDRLRQQDRYLSGEEVENLLACPDLSPGPGELAEAASEFEALVAAVEELPRRCQEILIAVRIEGQPQREVAQRLGISLRLVELELKRAQEYCAARMKRQSGS